MYSVIAYDHDESSVRFLIIFTTSAGVARSGYWRTFTAREDAQRIADELNAGTHVSPHPVPKFS